MAKSSIPNRNPSREICSVDNCSMLVRSKRLCSRHYNHWLKKGDLILTNSHGIGETEEERFWSRVDKDGPMHPTLPELGRCWVWLAPLSHGYGACAFQKRRRQASHISYFLRHGKFPVLFILHSCDNRACVNPDHLREGTHADNARDKMEHGNHLFGSKTPAAKLHETDVLAIRASNETTKVLAETYRMSRRAIRAIRSRATWKRI